MSQMEEKNKELIKGAEDLCESCSKESEISLSCLLCTYVLCNGCCTTSGSDFALVRKREKSCLCKTCFELVKLVEGKARKGQDGKRLDFEDRDTFESRFKEYWEIIKDEERLTLDDVYSPSSKEEKESCCKEIDRQESILGKRKLEEAFKRPTLPCQKRKKLSLDIFGDSSSDSKGEQGKDTECEMSILMRESEDIECHQMTSILMEKKKPVNNLERMFLKLFGPDNEDTECQMSKLGESKSEAELKGLNVDDVSSPDSTGQKEKDGESEDMECQESSASEFEASGSKSPEERYAEIVEDNIKLVYLRRSLVMDLFIKSHLQPPYSHCWERKLVGSFVRVRTNLLEANPCYLSQVTGTRSDDKDFHFVMQLSTGNQVPIYRLSDGDFTKEECMELKEKVENGNLSKLKFDEIAQKAKELHEDITKDWIDRELKRLGTCLSEAGDCETMNHYNERKTELEDPSEQERLLKKVPVVIAEGTLDLNN